MHELLVIGSHKLWQQGVLQQQNVYRQFLENGLFNIVQKLKWRTNHTNTRTSVHTDSMIISYNYVFFKRESTLRMQ